MDVTQEENGLNLHLVEISLAPPPGCCSFSLLRRKQKVILLKSNIRYLNIVIKAVRKLN